MTSPNKLAVQSPAQRHAEMLQLIGTNWTTKVVAVAAELRIADHLTSGAVPIGMLAEMTGCHPPSLLRLMKALTSLGLCHEDGHDSFALSELGEMLRADTDDALSSWAVWWGKYNWNTWNSLIDCVRTGKTARDLATGGAGYAHLEADAEAAAVFNRAMVQVTKQVAAHVPTLVDLSPTGHFVDIGGGHGALLAAMLKHYPEARGTLAELPHALGGATAFLNAEGLTHRVNLVGASFFEGVPQGGDAYFLKSILHNWDDEKCAEILANCRKSMAQDAKLVLIERIMPVKLSISVDNQAVARADLNMLVGLGGRERTLDEFKALLQDADFRIINCAPAALDFNVIEAKVGRNGK